jgi:hypothetical protein
LINAGSHKAKILSEWLEARYADEALEPEIQVIHSKGMREIIWQSALTRLYNNWEATTIMFV